MLFEYDDFGFTDNELAEIPEETAFQNEELFPFPFITKKTKGETQRVYTNNEELRSWLNEGLSEGALRFPVDRWGCGEVADSPEAARVCMALVGALRSVLTMGDNTRPMSPAKAWSLLRTLTKIDRDSVRRHSDAKHIAISGRMLSDAAVDWQVKSLRAAGGALIELKWNGFVFPEEATESHTDAKKLHVWGDVDKEIGEIELLRVVDFGEVVKADAEMLTQWANSMPPAGEKETSFRPRLKLPRLTDTQAKTVSRIKAKTESKQRVARKAHQKAAEESYEIPLWLSDYDHDMRLERDTGGNDYE